MSLASATVTDLLCGAAESTMSISGTARSTTRCVWSKRGIAIAVRIGETKGALMRLVAILMFARFRVCSLAKSYAGL